jgi:hypothetical protein
VRDTLVSELNRLSGDSGGSGSARLATELLPAADPKDKSESLERYRTALTLAADRKWSRRALFQQVLRDEPGATAVWNSSPTPRGC